MAANRGVARLRDTILGLADKAGPESLLPRTGHKYQRRLREFEHCARANLLDCRAPIKTFEKKSAGPKRRHIHPPAFGVAFEDRVEDYHLPQSIDELRIVESG